MNNYFRLNFRYDSRATLQIEREYLWLLIVQYLASVSKLDRFTSFPWCLL